ncbi:GNAT family N-acetyltransferase [Pacificispira sp.]|uniref:GNAT family N-acetyltransferase n=1 Tax=Pacificispira sp. TaxID=2888761 RepID=UPI003BAC84BF
MSELIIRPIRAEDYEAWDPLFHGYCDFYEVESTKDSRRITFDWLLDPAEILEGLVVERDGALIGLAHYREMPRPSRAQKMGFLDDLFVDPAARGGRVGEKIFDALREICRQRGWKMMRWLTQDHNYAARTLYDRVGQKSLFNLYEMTVNG